MDIELFKAISRYPFIFENTFFSSIELKQNKTCISKCNEKDCLSLIEKNNNSTEYVCSKGFDNLLFQLGEFKVILNGLIFETNSAIPTGRKLARKEYMVVKESLFTFLQKIHEIEKRLIEQENEATAKNFSIFHDFKTAMNIFYECTYAIINRIPGDTFEEKLKGSDPVYQDLYNAIDLMTSQLGMIDVILNPQSISFGAKYEINIFKLFAKFKILFEHLCSRKNVTIDLKSTDGGYINNSQCYQSIEFIPIILLDNAVKYAVNNSSIHIEMIQQYYSVRVSVKNVGPVVSEGNRERIFEKFFRDESAKEFTSQGIGMGLWIAQKILEAHGSKIWYDYDKKETRKFKLNIFSFDLPTG